MQGDYNLLIDKLNSFIREYYRNLMVRGVVFTFITLVLILILTAFFEHFGFFSSSIRTILFWSYFVLSMCIVIWLIVRPAIKMWQLTDGLSYSQAANIIGKHFPEISDKLINILELKNKTSGNKNLIEASVQQKIKTIKITTFNQAIDWEKTKFYSQFLIVPILIVILFFVSGNKKMLADSTYRIINYNSEFTKPLPFYFVINEDSLNCLEKEDLEIKIQVIGNERPEEAFINYRESKKKLKKISEDLYSYEIKNIRTNTQFFISANEVFSKEYEINPLIRPEIKSFNTTIYPPQNTKLNKEVLKNSGALTIPEGSLIKWEISTKNTDSIQFMFNNEKEIINQKTKDEVFEYKKLIKDESQYSVSLANQNALFIDTIFFDIKIIEDVKPKISIKKDSVTNLILGNIEDDYGFYNLKMVAKISGEQADSIINETIPIKPNQKQQMFSKSIENLIDSLEGWSKIEVKFIVRDNDKINGFKSRESELLQFLSPTYTELMKEYTETNDEVKNNINTELMVLKNLQKEVENFEKNLIEKKSIDWKDQKQLESILKKQFEIENKLSEFQKSTQNNFEKLNKEYSPSEKILKKQEELKKLFEEIIPEEMKELYDELDKLKNNLNKEDLQKKLRELQLSNEDLEKELDRNLEILKELEFEQRLESLITQLSKLSKDQINNSQINDELDREIEKQLNENKEFEDLKQEINELKKLNSKLENKKEIINTEDKENEISNLLNEAIEKLNKKQEKRASKLQKSAGEKLEDLSNLLKDMQSSNEEEQAYEDLDMLRQILENLIYFSVEKENIFLSFESLHKDDPKYVELMREQQELKDASIIIKDSLYALSKRMPQISSKVNREIRTIETKTNSAIDKLRERLTLKAVQDQQFVMTAANNLAVMLFRVLESMQNDMANSMPSSQQCQKKGNSKPKPGDLKKMQQQLQQQLENMKKQCESGQQNMLGGQMSRQLVEMLAKQELIRSSLEELRNQMDDKDGMNSLQKAIENMEKMEEDIVNKNITIESLMRQKKILTRLLEVENALREQDQDNKRESKTASTQYEKIVKETLEKYKQEQLEQIEMIKATPPSLNNYYKEKVDRYFKKMTSE